MILVTGSSGRVGAVVMAALGANARSFDLPSQDLLRAGDLEAAAAGCDQIVHLAWDVAAENHYNGQHQPANIELVRRVLQVATDHGVGRVVLASSVHARRPSSPYGRSKLTTERLGRAAAEQSGLDVVAVRLGGVTPARDPKRAERGLWLSADDCTTLFRMVLAAPVVAGRFSRFNAVSRSRWRRHSLRNEFGWRPATTRGTP